MNNQIKNAALSGSAAMASAAARPVVQKGIKICECGVYRGPHVYSFQPMVRLQVDLGDFELLPTPHLGEFAEKLLELLPGLAQHGCCYETPGGFVRRLHEGTWLGHVAEHVALEFQRLAGADVNRGKTRSVKGRPGVYNVMFEYDNETVALIAAVLAFRLLETLLPEGRRNITGFEEIFDRLEYELEASQLAAFAAAPFELKGAIEFIRAQHRERALGPTTMALITEARRRGIPVQRLDDSSLVQLGYGKNQRRVWAAMTSSTSQIAVDIAADKDLTKALCRSVGLPVPRGRVVQSLDNPEEILEVYGTPLVTKPLCGNHGRGVTLNIKTVEDLKKGFAIAATISRSVVIEEQYTGRDYRILVISGKIVAAAEREPAHVVGDGVHTVSDLIVAENKDPRRGEGHENVMTRIEVDDAVIQTLQHQGLTLAAVPVTGQKVYLRETANISTGGTAVDCTDIIHPDNAAIAERAAHVIGLDIAGIDFIAPDISKPVSRTGGGIVEVNAAPGLRMHIAPSSGQSRPVARAVIDTIFPDGAQSHIPIFSITGTNGKSTTALMLAQILRKSGLCVGLASTTGIFVNGRLVAKADASGPRSARAILRDPTVDAAVLETARGGIVREGLGFADCDVGAVLNVDKDHLGLRNIDSVEDLAWAKSLVVEVVHRNGVSVLNADCEHTRKMAGHAGGRVAFFTLNGDGMPAFLRDHIAQGGLAVVRRKRWVDEIVIFDRGREQRVMATADIPATIGGAADFNVANALAAIAMAYGHGIEITTIRSALGIFSTSFEDNPGRLNISDEHGFRVIVDYGHNQASLQAIGRLVARLGSAHGTVIGMLGMPGDRRDEDLKEMGRIAADIFDHIVLRETPDQRGRPSGSINDLMGRGATEAGFPADQISKFIEEFDAVDYCLQTAQPNDLVVLMATRFEEVWDRVKKFRPRTSTDLRVLDLPFMANQCNPTSSIGH